MNLYKKIIPMMIISAISNLVFAESRLIIQFAPTPEQKRLVASAKTLKEKNKDIGIVNTELSKSIAHDKLQALSVASGVTIKDFAV